MKKLILSLAWVSALLISNAFSSESIEETVVTSSFVHENLDDTHNPIHILSGEDLDSSGTDSLGESINGLLGVQSTDYGQAVGQPVIRGMSGRRVKILKNGMVNRDVSGTGADHINDIDLNDVQQIEIVRGPSSLLYANGGIGGIVNVVDNTIARQDIDQMKLKLGLEFQSVNDGDAQNISFANNIGGFNISAGYKDLSFDNYDIPDGAILHSDEEHHDEEHEDEEHEEHEEHMDSLANTDMETTAKRLGISKTGDWGFFGVSYTDIESVYGIPFHGDEHEGHDEDHDEEHEGEEHDEHDESGEMHGGGHEGERIFSSTESEKIDVKGSFLINSSWLKKVDIHYRDSEYSLIEAHAEEHHEEEHHDEEHEDEDHDEHHSEEPTLFSNDSKEYGATFDLSRDSFAQRIVLNYLEEDTAIVGSESFMNPSSSEETTIGYFFAKDFGGFNLDFGLRHDRIKKRGSVTHVESHEEHHDEEHEDEDHEDEDHDGEDHEEEHSETEYFDEDKNGTSFALSLGRQISDSLNVSAGFARVERAPSVVELYMNGPHLSTARYEVGDTTLDNEVSKNFDLSFKYEHDGLFGIINFFRNDVDNYIYLLDETEEEHEEHEHEDDHGGLILANYLQQDAEFEGYELELGKTFNLAGGGLTVAFARDDVSGEFSNGTNVPRMVSARNMYSVSYLKNDDFEIKLKLKDVERQSDISVVETMTPSYQMLDLKIVKVFEFDSRTKLTLSLFGNNLLDEAARNHQSFVKDQVPLPGRNYGLRLSLDY